MKSSVSTESCHHREGISSQTYGINKSPGSDPALCSPYEAALGPRGAGEKRLGVRGAHECQARGRAGGKGGAGQGAKLLTVVIDREGRQG
ncbi:unnamed protein product [Boreogadus saida]